MKNTKKIRTPAKIFTNKKPTAPAWKSIGVALLTSLIIGVIILCIVIGEKQYGHDLREGDVSLRNIYSPFDFTYKGEIDKIETDRLRERIFDGVNLVYEIDGKKSQEQIALVSKFFNVVEEIRQQDLSISEKQKQLENRIGIIFKSDFLNILLQQKTLSQIKNRVTSLLKTILETGVISMQNRDNLNQSGIEVISLLVPSAEKEVEKNIEEISTIEEIRKNLSNIVLEHFPKDRKLRVGIEELISSVLAPNLVFNKQLTEQRREFAMESVEPVYIIVEVKKNELIIGKGDRVTKKHLLQLSLLDEKLTKVDTFFNIFGLGIIVLILTISLIYYLRKFQPKLAKNGQYWLLISLITIILLVISRVIILSPLASYLIPVASSGMLVAILLNAHIAILLSLFISILAAIISGYSFGAGVVFFIGSLVGIYSIQGFRRRAHIIKAGAMVGIVSFLCIVGLGMSRGLEWKIFLKEGLWGLGNGVLSSFIVMGILPVFEFIFKITTNISLLELSDLNHPLLKEMILKSPGTYHHSLIVGNLAEAASEAVGTNSLLARVGSYYHDIGKIEKAEYFSENQTGTKSKHEKLTPAMSSLIITNHVRDGVELAKKYKLNNQIVDFIKQHHGTGLVFYFYQKALEKEGDVSEIKEERYRYPGPKPQSKETAIVLLADAVEAASRALSEPTSARIRGLAKKIINNKFINGQLDECELTLKDLNKIADVFSKILIGIYHSRVEYPEEGRKQKTAY